MKKTLIAILSAISLNASAQNWVDRQAGNISTSNIAVFQAVTGGLIDIEGAAAPCNAENDLTLGYVKSSNTIQLCDVSLGGWQVADEYDGEQAVINATTANITSINANTINSGSINLTSGIKATRLTDANNTGYYSDPSGISHYNVFRPGYIEPQVVVTKGAGCSPNGRIAKFSDDSIASCVGGIWKSALASDPGEILSQAIRTDVFSLQKTNHKRYNITYPANGVYFIKTQQTGCSANTSTKRVKVVDGELNVYVGDYGETWVDGIKVLGKTTGSKNSCFSINSEMLWN